MDYKNNATEQIKLAEGETLKDWLLQKYTSILEEKKEKEEKEEKKDNETDNEKEIAVETEVQMSLQEALLNNDCHVSVQGAYDTFSFYVRELYLGEEITNEDSDLIFRSIKMWNVIDEIDNIPIEDRTPIKIYIDTPGGDLLAVFSIIDAIQLSKTPVYTITMGTGYSGGFLIGMVGHKRFGMKNSSYLFHEGSTYSSCLDAHKSLQRASFYQKQLERLKNLVLTHTKIKEEDYEQVKKDDLWLMAEEALELGIIDEISTNYLV